MLALDSGSSSLHHQPPPDYSGHQPPVTSHHQAPPTCSGQPPPVTNDHPLPLSSHQPSSTLTSHHQRTTANSGHPLPVTGHQPSLSHQLHQISVTSTEQLVNVLPRPAQTMSTTTTTPLTPASRHPAPGAPAHSTSPVPGVNTRIPANCTPQPHRTQHTISSITPPPTGSVGMPGEALGSYGGGVTPVSAPGWDSSLRQLSASLSQICCSNHSSPQHWGRRARKVSSGSMDEGYHSHQGSGDHGNPSSSLGDLSEEQGSWRSASVHDISMGETGTPGTQQHTQNVKEDISGQLGKGMNLTGQQKISDQQQTQSVNHNIGGQRMNIMSHNSSFQPYQSSGDASMKRQQQTPSAQQQMQNVKHDFISPNTYRPSFQYSHGGNKQCDGNSCRRDESNAAKNNDPALPAVVVTGDTTCVLTQDNSTKLAENGTRKEEKLNGDNPQQQQQQQFPMISVATIESSSPSNPSSMCRLGAVSSSSCNTSPVSSSLFPAALSTNRNSSAGAGEGVRSPRLAAEVFPPYPGGSVVFTDQSGLQSRRIRVKHEETVAALGDRLAVICRRGNHQNMSPATTSLTRPVMRRVPSEVLRFSMDVSGMSRVNDLVVTLSGDRLVVTDAADGRTIHQQTLQAEDVSQKESFVCCVVDGKLEVKVSSRREATRGVLKIADAHHVPVLSRPDDSTWSAVFHLPGAFYHHGNVAVTTTDQKLNVRFASSLMTSHRLQLELPHDVVARSVSAALTQHHQLVVEGATSAGMRERSSTM